MKLNGKIIIKGSLITKTGLHLGGSKASLNIGGIENNVIKTALDVPYIPGSSIKGKLRSLLAKAEGSLFFTKDDKKAELNDLNKIFKEGKSTPALEKYKDIVEASPTDEDEKQKYLLELFGYSGDVTKRENLNHTRLLVRDAFLENEDAAIFREGYTGSKWENIINRKTGTAEHPRQLERVPVGASFGLELVYNIYQEGQTETNEVRKRHQQHLNALLLALQLLEDDGIGGSISRGYGQVKVVVKEVLYKQLNSETYAYETLESLSGAPQLLENFTQQFPQIT